MYPLKISERKWKNFGKLLGDVLEYLLPVEDLWLYFNHRRLRTLVNAKAYNHKRLCGIIVLARLLKTFLSEKKSLRYVFCLKKYFLYRRPLGPPISGRPPRGLLGMLPLTVELLEVF